MTRRSGYTLAELLIVLPLGLLLGALVIAGIVAQSRLTRQLTDLVSRAEAERITAGVLAAELTWAAPHDLRTDADDSLRARIFRGFGIPCPASAAAWRWFGSRAPAEHKDSVLIVSAHGEHVYAVTGAPAVPPCDGYRLAGAPPGAAALVFETGTYYLQDGALRFRSGNEGRQPLTDQWFTDSTALRRGARGEPLGVLLALRPTRARDDGELRSYSWTLPNHWTRP